MTISDGNKYEEARLLMNDFIIESAPKNYVPKTLNVKFDMVDLIIPQPHDKSITPTQIKS